MYIIPNGDVYVLRGIDIDKNYNHTLFSKNLTEQIDKFFVQVDGSYKYIKYKLSDPSRGGYYSYQRVNSNSIKVRINANNLYDCNYLIFDNTRYFLNDSGDNEVVNYNTPNNTQKQKWFFAFIDEVNYINENTTEIKYTIDIMQTYMFDYTIENCYIEREHTTLDNMFQHIKPDIESNGNYVQKHITDTNSNKLYGGIILNKELPTGTYRTGYDYHYSAIGAITDTKYSPANTNPYCYVYMNFPLDNEDIGNTTQYNTLATKIWSITSGNYEGYDESNIMAVFTYPADWYNSGNWSVSSAPNQFTSERDIYILGSDITGTSYTPINNKCYTFQYNRLMVSDNKGSEKRYAYELMEGYNDGQGIYYIFKAFSNWFLFPNLMLIPGAYKQYDTARVSNYDCAMSLSDFPEPIYVGSYLNEWLNQNRSSIDNSKLVGTISNILQVLGGFTAKSNLYQTNVAYHAFALPNAVVNQYALESGIGAKKEDLIRQAGRSYIGSNQNFLGSANKIKMCLSIWHECLEASSLKTVDDYFSMYGYNISEIKQPNIIAQRTSDKALIRKHWNFIKTQNCDIHTTPNHSCPSLVKTQIESIYNNGITFWNELDEMGNYSNLSDNHNLINIS